MINDLDQITRRKLKSLAAQKDEIETLQAQVSSCLEFTRDSLKADIQQREVLVMKTSIIKQIQELTATPQPNVFTLTIEADTVFMSSENAVAMCREYGRVYTLNSPDPSKCVATGRGTEEAVVGEKATAILNAPSFKGSPCNSILSFSAELVSEITGSKVVASIEHSQDQGGQGQYQISYQPSVKGRHHLHITADGQHIRGSPFSITVKLPVEKLGNPIQTWSDLGKVLDAAINRKGEVIVTRHGDPCVSVFSSCGRNLRSYSTFGDSEGELQFSTGVAEDDEGNLMMCDIVLHSVKKFTADGHFLKAVNNEGSGKLQFNFPTNIAYHPWNKKLYVVDSENHRVQVLNSDLTYFSQFGRRGSSNGFFNHPIGIAINSAGRVHVTDRDNHRIQVFTAEGKFLTLFGRKGAGQGELAKPAGIIVDASGLVYVSETSNHRVSVFTSEGAYVTSFGSEGSGPGQFKYPCGLAVDSSGVVYVCDRINQCVQLF